MTPQAGDELSLPSAPRPVNNYAVIGGIAALAVLAVWLMGKYDGTDTASVVTVHSADAPLPKARPVPLFPPQNAPPEAEALPAAIVNEPATEPRAEAPPWKAFTEDHGHEQIVDIDALPPSVRDQMQPLKLTGHLYSLAHPNARKVILNGTALKEKQYLNDRLMVDEITPDGVIIEFDGRLFHIGADRMFR